MKILVACELPDFALEELRSLGTELSYAPNIEADDLPKAIRGVSVLVVGKTRVTAEAIAASPTLQMIVKRGTDTSNISIEEASAEGVFITTCPNTDAAANAEFIFAQLLTLDRQVVAAAEQCRAGKASTLPEALGLAGRRLGLLGFDAVGVALNRRARAFGLDVTVCAASMTPGAAGKHRVNYCTWPRELARDSDIVVGVLAPQAEPTLLIDGEVVQHMKPGASLAYVGPPHGLDETAVLEGVRSRGLRAAIDLYTSDAQRMRSALRDEASILLTQNLAWRTRQARHETAREIVRIVRDFLVKGAVRHCVNLLRRSAATWQLVLRLRDAVGVMAAIMDAIRADGINAEEISTRVFSGARAVSCTIALDERPIADALDAIAQINGVLHLEVRAMI